MTHSNLPYQSRTQILQQIFNINQEQKKEEEIEEG